MNHSETFYYSSSTQQASVTLSKQWNSNGDSIVIEFSGMFLLPIVVNRVRRSLVCVIARSNVSLFLCFAFHVVRSIFILSFVFLSMQLQSSFNLLRVEIAVG